MVLHENTLCGLVYSSWPADSDGMGCTLCRKDLTGSSEPEPIWSGRGYPSGGERAAPSIRTVHGRKHGKTGTARAGAHRRVYGAV